MTGVLDSAEFGATDLMTTVSLAVAAAQLDELVDQAIGANERVTMTRHDVPAVVLLTVEDLESLEETLFWASEPDIRKDVAAGRAEHIAGTLADEATVRNHLPGS